MKHTLLQPDQKLSTWSKLGFGVGAVPSGITHAVIGFYLSPFFLETAKVPPGVLSIVLLVGKVVDALTDPMVGLLSDSTRTRWGRRVPWLAASVVPCAVSYFLLWTVPISTDDDSTARRTLYHALCLCLYNAVISCYHVPYLALTMELSEIEAERAAATSVRMAADVVSVMVGVGVQGVFVGDSSSAKGYMYSAVVMSCLVLVAGFIPPYAVKERSASLGSAGQQEQAPSAAERLAALKLLLSSPAYLFLMCFYLCVWMAVQVMQANLVLFCKYYADLQDHFQYMLMTLIVSTFCCIPIWNNLVVPRLGKRTTCFVGSACFAPCVALLYFTEPGSTPLYYAGAAAGGLGVSAGYLMPWLMLPDVVDDTEVRTGCANEGMHYSFFVFFQKLAVGLALAGSSAALEAAGYVAPQKCPDDIIDPDCSEKTMPPAVGEALRVLVSAGPMCLLLLSCAFMYFYPITTRKAEDNRSVLVSRRPVSRRSPLLADSSGLLSQRTWHTALSPSASVSDHDF